MVEHDTDLSVPAYVPMLHVAVAAWQLGPEPSGANRRQLSLLRAVASHLLEGERMTILCAPDAPELHPAPGVEVRRVPIPAAPTWRRVLAERRALPGILADIGATVLDLGTLPVPHRLSCPVVLTVHDLRDLTRFRRRPRRLARAALRRSAARVDQLVTPSAFTARALRAALSETAPPITIVPGGVEEAFFRHVIAEPAQPYFLHVGHIEPRKNLAMLLEAYALFLERAPGQPTPPALRLVGRDHGHARALRRRIAQLGLRGRVLLDDSVDERALIDLYGGATAILFPSLYEGFGLPALEALAMGQPLMVSDQGALPEIVGGAARVLPADQPEAWCAALLDAWQTEPTEAQARKRRLRARAFRWDDAGARLLQVWRRAQRL